MFFVLFFVFYLHIIGLYYNPPPKKGEIDRKGEIDIQSVYTTTDTTV